MKPGGEAQVLQLAKGPGPLGTKKGPEGPFLLVQVQPCVVQGHGPQDDDHGEEEDACVHLDLLSPKG